MITLKEILVDSSVLIDYLRNETSPETDALLESSSISLSIISFIEVCKYFHRTGRARDWPAAKSRLLAFKMIGLNAAIGESAARLSAFENLPLADAIIYATASTHHLIIATSDSDLKRFKNVLFVKQK